VIVIADLFAEWKTWCEDNGHKSGSVQTFGRDLRAVVPHLRVARPRDGESNRERRYAGVKLRESTRIHNGSERGPSRTTPENAPLVRSGPRPNPLLAGVNDRPTEDLAAADVADKSEGTQTLDELFGACEVGGDINACLNNNCRVFHFCVVDGDEGCTP
jgi:hypothetical protein